MSRYIPVETSGGKIITFYSYQGGVGRTMILANVAWILASNGKRVLVVDWDLEAPGLHRYFHPFLLDKDLKSTEGLIDFFNDFIDAALIPVDDTEGANENWHEPYANILRYAVSLEWDFPGKGTIDFVPAGKQGNLYAMQVNLFNWEIFYERFGGGAFLETVKEKMRIEYDYILIDSRTGVSDTSGICTVQMPDRLVVVFSANNQSILGGAGITTSVNQQWQASKNRSQDKWQIFPVLARTDRTEIDKLDLARNYSKTQFAPFLQHLSEKEREEYWGNVEIPYIPWYAYEEVLVTFRDNPAQRESLLAAIEQLVIYLTDKEVSELVAPSQEEREKILPKFSRQFSTKSSKSGDKIKILILAANPYDMDKLHLTNEIREISEVLAHSKNSGKFVVEHKLGIDRNNFRRAILESKPNIVHFCGHETGKTGIALVDEEIGNTRLVPTEALAGFFKLVSDYVKCVVLNACSTESQVDAIKKHIEHVFDMRQEIGNKAAIEFAAGFYSALGAGESFEKAYEFGRNAIQWLPQNPNPEGVECE
jgi:MinD-like ATPase involved in chromosome partitioning or flagellar assembly